MNWNGQPADYGLPNLAHGIEEFLSYAQVESARSHAGRNLHTAGNRRPNTPEAGHRTSGGMPVLEIGIAGLFRKCVAVPYIFVGFGLYGVSAILWLEVLSKLDISVAFPMVSLTYIATLFVGRFLFNEPVNLCRVVGVLLICSGVFFVIQSQ